MKKSLSKIIPILFFFWIVLFAPVGLITGVSADQNSDSSVKGENANVGYLENVLFEKLSGRERINLVVSQQPVIEPPSIQSDGSLLIKLGNLFAPENIRELLDAGQLLNVSGVNAQQVVADGKQSVNLTVYLKENVPYAIRQEGKLIVIDFNTSSIEAKLDSDRRTVLGKNGDNPSVDDSNDRDLRSFSRREAAKQYTDRIISLDFQDANIKSVLRLMAEYGNVSIISGSDVKGNVTLTMKNVPWDQALDAILNIQGLTKQQTGDLITVMTLERRKKDEQIKKAAQDEMRKAEEQRKAMELKDKIEKGKLRQILIEAKIVEATESFSRGLGIQWGFGNHASIGSYGLGVSAGTNSSNQFNAQTMSYPVEIPFVKSGTTDPLTMAAVNFPANILGPTLGLVFGGSRFFIETQIAALEATAQGRIISSPKVVTMDNVKAIIKQGEEVPYVTPASGTSPATVAFKEAVLQLEVKPKITSEGRISMQIKAKNDTPDYALGATLPNNNPPIRKNEVDSQVVVQDGDTVVIGGVFRNQEDKAVSGIPWFYKIPVLGWLFKTEDLSREKKQLLIFITPKILSESGYVEDECDIDKAFKSERCRNIE